MKYLADSRREDPARVMDGARSIIVTALTYNRAQPYSTQVSPTAGDAAPRGWISRYAWGDDYHDVMKRNLEDLIAALHLELPQRFEARAYADTGPIHERIAAHHAGLGWLAKNTLLINEQLGSWFFLGVIVTDLDLHGLSSAIPNELAPDLCGTCSLCIDACPTGAIVEPYVLDARRCISYLTIELRGAIPDDLRTPMGRMVFGCDICQDVCPWNHKAATDGDPAFDPRALDTPTLGDPKAHSPSQCAESLFAPLLEVLASLSEEQYRRTFRGSAIKRAKWRGLVRNACVALGNSKLTRGHTTFERITSLLRKLAEASDPIISEHARWALGRLGA
jgi:epoxyqueuosine reductase